MINTKKGPTKKFNNNPPKRDLHKTEKFVQEDEIDVNRIGHLISARQEKKRSSPVNTLN